MTRQFAHGRAAPALRARLVLLAAGLLGIGVLGASVLAAPGTLQLTGFPFYGASGKVLSLQAAADALDIVVDGGEGRRVHIAPWPEALAGVHCENCQYTLRSAPLPDGPFWRLEVRRDSELVLVIGKHTRPGQPVLPDWSLVQEEADPAAPDADLQPVSLQLASSTGSKAAPLGRMVKLRWSGDDWIFLLIGIQGSGRPARPRVQPQNPDGSPGAAPGELSDDVPPLLMDWVAVNPKAVQ